MNEPAFVGSTINVQILKKSTKVDKVKKTENIKEYQKKYKKTEKWQKYLSNYVETHKDVINAKKREDRNLKKEVYNFLMNCIDEKLIKFSNKDVLEECCNILNIKLSECYIY